MGAARTGEPGTPGLLDVLRGSAALCLRLLPLSLPAVAAIVRGYLADDADGELCDACWQASGDVPFHLIELLRVLREAGSTPRAQHVRTALPEAVLRSVIARLGRLDADCTALARAVAVLGQDADLLEASTLAELDVVRAERAADALWRAGMMQEGEPLLTSPRAQPHVVSILRASAVDALRMGDSDAAYRQLERALREPPDQMTRPDVLLELAETEAISGRPGAVAHAEAALAVISDPARRIEARESLATMLLLSGEFSRARDMAGQARRELPADHPRQDQLLAIQLGSAMLDSDAHEVARDALATGSSARPWSHAGVGPCWRARSRRCNARGCISTAAVSTRPSSKGSRPWTAIARHGTSRRGAPR